MELLVPVPHPLVLGGGGILIWLGDVSSSLVNLGLSPGQGIGLKSSVLGISRFQKDDILANILSFLAFSILCLSCLNLWGCRQPLDLLGIILGLSWMVPSLVFVLVMQAGFGF